jgi:hypothetical protein
VGDEDEVEIIQKGKMTTKRMMDKIMEEAIKIRVMWGNNFKKNCELMKSFL